MAGQTIQNKSVAPILKRSWAAEVVAAFAVGAAVDLAIAGILCWYLHREMSIFDRINSLLTRIILYTLATRLATRCSTIIIDPRRALTLPPSFFALGILIAYVAWPDTFIFLAMHFSQGRMYTNALLAAYESHQAKRKRGTQIHLQTAIA
ncbi:hypothetical protein C8R45DRAFT_1097212 [Mycena sanguinolenta]|nr:hypothetical protein C8R45DRAFT_1097212 [Mycena sanguinolenta]